MFITSEFRAAWWLSNAHGQTILAKYLKRNQIVNTIDEIVECPDGDFVELAWTDMPTPNSRKPIIVLLHGLAGSKHSHYAKGMLNSIKQRGWHGVLMHFRGCGKYPNRHAHSYHSGDTRDITFISQRIQMLFPNAPLAAIGFSLGGNVLANYLAEQPTPFRAAAIVCAPLHLASCSRRINQGLSKLYQKYLVDMLKRDTMVKMNQQLLPQLSTNQLNAIHTMWQFDQQVTAPINGFVDAADYYQQASGRDKLSRIRTPCLILHAQDDPFLDHACITQLSPLPKQVQFELTKKGGHVGFISGNNPLKPVYWLEQRLPNYLASFL